MVEWEDCDCGKCVSTEWWSGKIVTVGEVCEYRVVEWEDCDCGESM